jgi:hypothetical protein
MNRGTLFKNRTFCFSSQQPNTIYPFRLAGYEDVNDAERLAQDPTFRLMGSDRIRERGGALTSRLQSFETELATREENLSSLAAINRKLIARAEAIDSPQRRAT